MSSGWTTPQEIDRMWDKAWEKFDMQDEDLRLECIRLVRHPDKQNVQILKEAEELFQYVRNGAAPPPQ